MKNRIWLRLAVPLLLMVARIGYAGFNFFCSGDDFPVIQCDGDDSKPLIFYLSGDAGFNSFTKSMGENFQKKGFETVALDTKKYFWVKKTPQQTAEDVQSFLETQLNGRPNKKVILVGFSFGADVTPFVYNLLPESLKKNILKVFIIGPSKSNDFEIHLNEYLGVEPKGSLPVIPQINRMKNIPISVILSDFEFRHFPYQQINPRKKLNIIHISGDHHYGGNTAMLTDTVIRMFP